MRINKNADALTNYQNDKRVISITLKGPEEWYFDGITLHVNKNIIFIHKVDNLQLDGIVAIPMNKIKRVEIENTEIIKDAIFRYNESLRALSRIKWIHAAYSLQDLISALKKRDIWPIIKTMDDRSYLGPITQVYKTRFSGRHYSTSGQWFEEEYMVSFRNILLIEFNSVYQNIFNNYMKNHAPIDRAFTS